MTNIFQVSHILQFILGAFGVILLISYMTDFSLPLSFPVSKCNIQSATLRVQYGKCYSFLPIRFQIFLRACDKHNSMYYLAFWNE